MAAATRALERARVQAADVAEVRAEVHPDSASVVCDASRDLTRPASAYGAKFSLPWSIAALLVDGRVGIDTYTEDQLHRADIAELASRVSWTVTEPRGVAADAPGDVVLVLGDGRRVDGHVAHSPGGADSPLADAELLEKLEGNVGPEAGALAKAVAALPSAPDLTSLISRAARAADAPWEARP
jgi:2-methylcitrate dehydratase PrpD